MTRRFAPPWSAEELEESFAIKDSTAQVLAYVYFEPDPQNETRRRIMNRLTHDEARGIAVNIAKLPALIEAEKKHNANDERKDRSLSTPSNEARKRAETADIDWVRDQWLRLAEDWMKLAESVEAEEAQLEKQRKAKGE